MPFDLQGMTAFYTSNIGDTISSMSSSSSDLKYFNKGFYATTSKSANPFVALGYSVSFSAGTTLQISWSGLDGYYSAVSTATGSLDPAFSATKLSQSNNSVSTFSIFAQDKSVLYSDVKSSGSVTLTLDRDVTFIGLGFIRPSFLSSSNSAIQRQWVSIGGSNFVLNISASDPINDAILGSASSLADIANSNRGILGSLDNLTGVLSNEHEQAMEESTNGMRDSYVDSFAPGGSGSTNSSGYSSAVDSSDVEQFASTSQSAQEMMDTGVSPDKVFDFLNDNTDASQGWDSPWGWFSQANANSMDLGGGTPFSFVVHDFWASVPSSVDDDYISFYDLNRQRFLEMLGR